MEEAVVKGYSFAEVQPPFAYTCDVVAAPEVNAIQPLGALGGAPRFVHALLIRTVAGRLSTSYAVEALQAAHFLVMTTLDGPEPDPVVQTAHAWCRVSSAATLADQEAALPGLTAALAVIPDTTPAWNTGNSSGAYGAVYSAYYTSLQERQRLAAAVERAAVPPGTHTTRIAAYASVQLERSVAGGSLRYLTPAETQTALLWASKQWNADIKQRGKPALPWADSYVCNRLLEQRQELESERCTRLLQSAMASHVASSGASPAPTSFSLEGVTYLHMTAVFAHMARPGAGVKTVQTVCDVADEHSLPVMLEAVPTGLLVTYYEQFGFQAVHWEGPGSRAFGEQCLSKQQWVIMWRAARPKAEGADMPPTLHPTLTEQVAALMVGSGEYCRKPYAYLRKPSKLEAYHLSVATEKLCYADLAWSKKDMDGTVNMFYTWALEVQRLLRAGEWPGSPFKLPAVEDIPPAPTPTPTASGGRKRALSPSASSGSTEETVAASRPLRRQASPVHELLAPVARHSVSIQTSPGRFPPPPSVLAPGLVINVQAGASVYITYAGVPASGSSAFASLVPPS